MKFIYLLEGINPDKLPIAKSVVNGLKVLNKVDNQSSIDSSLDDYEILRGIREVPINVFDYKLSDLFYAKNDIDRARDLAERIKQSKTISPLIVVHDSKGYYVLEGGHRLGALGLLGIKKLPAMVVKDLEG